MPVTPSAARSSMDAHALKTRLSEIAAGIETLSGAPVADSAAILIDGKQEAYAGAAEALTIGLSAAH